MRIAVALQTPEVTRNVPVCLFTGTFEERLAKAARAGAQGVELMTVEPARLDPARLRGQVESAGLEVAAVGSGAVAFAAGLTLLAADEEVAAAARERLRELLAFAAAIGAPLLTIGSFRGWSGGDRYAERVLGDMLALEAAGSSVVVVLEMLNRYESDLLNDCAAGLQFLSVEGRERLRLLLDTYHMNVEERSPAEALRSAMRAGALRHVHIGDSNRLPPGRGHIDFAALVGVLRDGGYNGWLSAELLAKPDPDTAGQETVAYLRKLLAE